MHWIFLDCCYYCKNWEWTEIDAYIIQITRSFRSWACPPTQESFTEWLVISIKTCGQLEHRLEYWKCWNRDLQSHSKTVVPTKTVTVLSNLSRVSSLSNFTSICISYLTLIFIYCAILRFKASLSNHASTALLFVAMNHL